MRRILSFLSALLFPIVAIADDAVSVLVIADLPYDRAEAASLSALLESSVSPIDRNSHPDVILHLGDFKKGSSPCSFENLSEHGDFELRPDEILHGLTNSAERENTFRGVFAYTPGDNDWTDCERAGTGPELDRLSDLSQILGAGAYQMPGDNISTGDDVVLGELFDAPASEACGDSRHHDFNRHWRIGSVHFVTLHVVGTNNGRFFVSVGEDDRADDDETSARAVLELVDLRDQCNMDWLSQAVSEADDLRATALVVAMHADLWNEDQETMGNNNAEDLDGSSEVRSVRNVECVNSSPLVMNSYGYHQHCDGHYRYRLAVAQAAQSLSQHETQVLLLSGDTNPFCFIDPAMESVGLAAEEVGPLNLWRLNALGDYLDEVDGVRIKIDPHGERLFEVAFASTDAPLAPGRLERFDKSSICDIGVFGEAGLQPGEIR